MLNQIIDLQTEARDEILKMRDLTSLEQTRVKYLGRKGLLPQLLKKIGSLPADQKPQVGKVANECKERIEQFWEERFVQLKQSMEELKEEKIDLTLPGLPSFIGHKHPVSQILEESYQIFAGLGFEIVDGPEIEEDYYNFEALNIPKDHPARDMHDTFYISEEVLLRTHTSPVQIRTMKERKPPIRIIAPGKVYRRDADVSHTPMFHQMEGLLVDTSSSFSELKGILTAFVHQMFDPQTRLRFRPSFFPFTEPSAEVDISCVMCRGSGCRLCSNTGWLEILGAGMVHPEVFRSVGYDPERFVGFAFGMGMERIALLKYGIDDIRLFYENDLRFLAQF
ncbi:MAG: phenylalanine--tRNA ligase subunit alpha [bacterium]